MKMEERDRVVIWKYRYYCKIWYTTITVQLAFIILDQNEDSAGHTKPSIAFSCPSLVSLFYTLTKNVFSC